jgi:hypothetical protein
MSLALSTMPRLELAAEELVKFSRGQFLKVGEPWCRMSPNQSIAILNTAGDLVAVGRPHDGDTIRPEVVLVRE